MDSGFRQIDGGDRGGDTPAPPFGRAAVARRAWRAKPANDNVPPLARRLRRRILPVMVAATLLGLAWAAFR